MNLSTIPNELWNIILSNLELKDVINFYKAYPTTIDYKLFNYLPLNDKNLWENGIVYVNKICDTCHTILCNKIKDKLTETFTNLYFDIDESKFVRISIKRYKKEALDRYTTSKDMNKYYNKIKYNIELSDDEEEDLYMKDCCDINNDVRYINYRKYIEQEETEYFRDLKYIVARYSIELRHSNNIVLDSQTTCVYHDLPMNILVKLYNLVIETYLLNGNKSIMDKIKLCKLCGKYGHKQYTKKCLFATNM